MRLAKAVRKQVREHISKGFSDELRAAFQHRFELELDVSYNIFEMALVSRRADEADFTPEQKAFVFGFELGYSAAMERLEPPARAA